MQRKLLQLARSCAGACRVGPGGHDPVRPHLGRNGALKYRSHLPRRRPRWRPSTKPFPGTIGDDPSFFDTLTFNAEPGTVVTVTTTLLDGVNSFVALYDDTFTLADLSQGYLGDQGLSITNVFTVLVPAGRNLTLVLMDVGNGVGLSVAGEINFTPGVAAVPKPSALALLVVGAGGAGRLCWRKRRAA